MLISSIGYRLSIEAIQLYRIDRWYTALMGPTIQEIYPNHRHSWVGGEDRHRKGVTGQPVDRDKGGLGTET